MDKPDLSNPDDEFDFDDVAISEEEYQNFLESLLASPGVDEVTHSLAMNEITVAISEEYTGTITVEDFPEGITISHVEPWVHDDPEDTRSSLRLRTTKWFSQPSEQEEVFVGEYSDDSMVALDVELSLFEEIESVTKRRDGEEIHVGVEMGEVTDTLLFDDVLTYLGYSINQADFEAGELTSVWFEFDTLRAWNTSTYSDFQHTKLRRYRDTMVDNSGERMLPCGHTAEPTNEFISDIKRDTLEKFPTVTQDELSFYKVPVEVCDGTIKSISEWPDGITPDTADGEGTYMAHARGYVCQECSCMYAFTDMEKVSSVLSTDSKPPTSTVTQTFEGKSYDVTFAPFAARTVGDRSKYLSD